jgi:hypothetical protein
MDFNVDVLKKVSALNFAFIVVVVVVIILHVFCCVCLCVCVCVCALFVSNVYCISVHLLFCFAHRSLSAR